MDGGFCIGTREAGRNICSQNAGKLHRLPGRDKVSRGIMEISLCGGK